MLESNRLFAAASLLRSCNGKLSKMRQLPQTLITYYFEEAEQPLVSFHLTITQNLS